jgi:hypothetical protein
VVVGGAPRSEDELHRVAAGLFELGAGELVMFDPAAGRAGSPAWMIRSAGDLAHVRAAAARTLGDDVAYYVVDSHDAHGAPSPDHDRRGVLQLEPGVRKVTLHRRLPGTTAAHYADRFAAHGPIAAIHHANASRYRQSLVVEYDGPPGGAADGMSEHWYASFDDAIDRHFAREDSRAVVAADVAAWLDVATARVGYGRAWRWS